MDLKEIQALIKLLEETAMTEIEVEEDGRRIRIRKEPSPTTIQVPNAYHEAPTAALQKENRSQVSGIPLSPSEKIPVTESVDPLVAVRSPIVGTFYASHAQDAEPYVKVGDSVKKGQTLCIVEAMKLMNEIESDLAGTVAVICVEDKASVEFGQPLFKIEPAG
ncbi:MAG: acetyl-CoA carboxylase biotin carboxyl carrier protein [Nitrospirota bacterium]